jgi:hypothetical protein
MAIHKIAIRHLFVAQLFFPEAVGRLARWICNPQSAI